jgi:hypothetical protein
MPMTRPHASAARPTDLAAAPRGHDAAAVPASMVPELRDLGGEQRRWEADLPAVTAAIATLTRPLELCDRSTATRSQWYHHSPDLELSIAITAQAVGAATEVDLTICPAGTDPARPAGRGALRNIVVYGAAVIAAVLVLALFLVGSGDIWVLLLIGLIDLIFTVSLVLGLFVIPARRLALEQEAWARTWRRSFWAALEARLHHHALYR